MINGIGYELNDIRKRAGNVEIYEARVFAEMVIPPLIDELERLAGIVLAIEAGLKQLKGGEKMDPDEEVEEKELEEEEENEPDDSYEPDLMGVSADELYERAANQRERGTY